MAIRKRSSCDSGNGYAPICSTGFCVAMTKNGSESFRVSPSCETLALLHRFHQCALRFRRRTVDLVGQDHRMEDRAGVEAERARLGVEDRHAQHVGRQEVARELDACVLEAERGRKRLGEGGLADARDVLDQQVAAGQETREGKPQGFALADDDAIELGENGSQALGDRNIGLAQRADGHGRFFLARVPLPGTLACNVGLVITGERGLHSTRRRGGAVRRRSARRRLLPVAAADIKQTSCPPPTSRIPSFLLHDMGPYHPECPDRLRAIGDRLISAQVDGHLVHHTAPAAGNETLARVHSRDYIATIEAESPASGLHYLDPDTAMNAHSLTAARPCRGRRRACDRPRHAR
jgi:hypothetical protein